MAPGWLWRHRCRAYGPTRTIQTAGAWPLAGALGGVVILTMLLASCQALPGSPVVVASPTATQQTVVVHVQERITGGNTLARPPTTANATEIAAFVTPGPQPTRAGLLVRAVASTAPQRIVAEQRTDAQGVVRLTLPAGTSWIFAPWSDPPGYPAARAQGLVRPDHRPDGALVLCWTAVTLPAAHQADVTLTYTLTIP